MVEAEEAASLSSLSLLPSSWEEEEEEEGRTQPSRFTCRSWTPGRLSSGPSRHRRRPRRRRRRCQWVSLLFSLVAFGFG